MLNALAKTRFAFDIEPHGSEQIEEHAEGVGQDVCPFQMLTEDPGLGGFEDKAEGDYGRGADKALPGRAGGTAGDEG